MAVCQIKRVNGNSSYDDIKLKTTASSITNFSNLVEDIYDDMYGGMTSTIYKTRKQLHTTNPVLSAGQIAVESDTGRVKIGDGTTIYSLIPYQLINQL